MTTKVPQRPVQNKKKAHLNKNENFIQLCQVIVDNYWEFMNMIKVFRQIRKKNKDIYWVYTGNLEHLLCYFALAKEEAWIVSLGFCQAQSR